MSAGHHPGPMEEAQDYYGWWHLFGPHDGWGGIPLLDLYGYGIPFAITRFMVVQLIAALIVAYSFIWLARRIENGAIARGTGANLLESLLLFVRNDIVRPVLGGPQGDFLLPYIWTVFFYILTCNLLGMLPLIGSPMASLWITMSLALCSLVMMIAVPIYKLGFFNYLKTMWIPVDIPVLGIVVSLMLFVIEFAGQFIKGAVLGLRLFCNILVGHVVLATIISFAAAVSYLSSAGIKEAGLEQELASVFSISGLGALLGSVIGAILLSLLELLVAFLQAYVFALLTTLFIALPLQHHADHEAAHGHDHDHHEPHGEPHKPAAAH